VLCHFLVLPLIRLSIETIKMFVSVICVSTNLYSTVFPQFLVGSFVGSLSIVICFELKIFCCFRPISFPLGIFLLRRRVACLPFYSRNWQMSFVEETVANQETKKNGERFLTSITYWFMVNILDELKSLQESHFLL
jgi:hypothetical protein